MKPAGGTSGRESNIGTVPGRLAGIYVYLASDLYPGPQIVYVYPKKLYQCPQPPSPRQCLVVLVSELASITVVFSGNFITGNTLLIN